MPPNRYYRPPMSLLSNMAGNLYGVARFLGMESTFEQTEKSRIDYDQCDRSGASCKELTAKAIHPVARAAFEEAAKAWRELARLLRAMGR
jgi:hypothetical protein